MRHDVIKSIPYGIAFFKADKKKLYDTMSQSSERSIYGFRGSQGKKSELYSAAYPGRALRVAVNSLLHNHKKTNIKKKEENPIRKGGPSEYSGGFSFVQEQDKRILFTSDLGFRNIYGIFYISNRDFKNIGSGYRSRSCSMGSD